VLQLNPKETALLKGKMIVVFALMVGVLAAAATPAMAAKEFKAYESSGTLFKGEVKVKGMQTTAQKFSIGSAVVVECAKLEGELTGTSPGTQLTGEPKYTECKATVSGVKTAATVAANGCVYNYHAENSLTVECPKGASITVTAGSLCTIKVGAQGPLKELLYKPLKTKTTKIEVSAKVSPITQENNCGATGTVLYEGGALGELNTPAGGTEEVVE
jgi:hypothetical protein